MKCIHFFHFLFFHNFFQILFGGRVIERPFTAMLPIHTHAYNLQRDHWKSRSNNSSFTPHVETLQEMDQVFVDNNFPLTPFSHIELPPQRRRTLMDDFQSYSPPRRVRKCHRHSVIDQTVNLIVFNFIDKILMDTIAITYVALLFFRKLLVRQTRHVRQT